MKGGSGRLAAVMRLVAARSHGVDASHDFTHVRRVADVAARLAREEGVVEARARSAEAAAPVSMGALRAIVARERAMGARGDADDARVRAIVGEARKGRGFLP